jgi:hypothetical protein
MIETKDAFKSLFVRRALPGSTIPPIYPFLMQLQDRVRQNEPDTGSSGRCQMKTLPVDETASVGRIVRLAQKRIQSTKAI